MSACGSCPTCAQGVPVCVGGICVAPEEAFVHGSFLFAAFAACFNFFVAQRDSVKRRLSQNMRTVVFFLVPVLIAVACVHAGVLEIPTLEALSNSIFGKAKPTAAAKIRAHLQGHGHAHGHATYHEDGHGHGHIGHFHN